MAPVKNLKLAFPGICSEFIAGELDDYAEAIDSGTVLDAVASIQRQFFKRFPVTLADNKDPSAEWLDKVDDNAAEPEILVPNEDSMTPDEYNVAMAEHKDLINKIEKKKEVSSVGYRVQTSKSYSLFSFSKSPVGLLICTKSAPGLLPRTPLPTTCWLSSWLSWVLVT